MICFLCPNKLNEQLLFISMTEWTNWPLLSLYCYIRKRTAATTEKWKTECDTDQFLFFGVAAIRFRSYLIYSVNTKNVAFLPQNYIVLL